jgi:hypothetical protein
MTATKDRLAAELRLQGQKSDAAKQAVYEAIAVRAATGEFDDYADVHVCGPTALHALLLQHGLTGFARRVANGEFDASWEESEEWARKQNDPQLSALMRAMGLGPDRSKDQ